jgi:NAD(P)H-flavin reductase/Fe-S-cluster-containing hydrogenase component 2
MLALGSEALPDLISVLRSRSDRLVGPTVRDGAIVLREIESAADLPAGYRDVQAPGRYRLARVQTASGRPPVFGYVVGPNSAKEWLLPAVEPLYTAERRPDGRVGFRAVRPAAPRTVLLGLRACDVAAVRKQDRILREGSHVDTRYAARRDATLLVAVTCTAPGPLCFCVSTRTGPKPGEGADLVLTELGETLLLEPMTPAGAEAVTGLPTRPARDDERAALAEAVKAAEASMGRALDLDGLPERLYARLDHPRYSEVAARCLACGNCTSVCPTCFCTDTVETPSVGAEAEVVDVGTRSGEASGAPAPTDASGAPAPTHGRDGAALVEQSGRERQWLSCFSAEHGRIHGFDPRPRTLDRYRQWVTHKLGGWVAQFAESGCTGCGRCIAWCPVGIDLVEEVRAITESPEKGEEHDDRPAPRARPVAMPSRAGAVAPSQRREEDLTPRVARVRAVRRETHDVVTLVLDDPLLGADELGQHGVTRPWPGRFQMLSVPGVGESAISLSSAFAVEHTVRAVGPVSRALCALRPGDELGVRGPFGNGWPLELGRGVPVTVVAGGLGLAPLRGAVQVLIDDPVAYPEVRVLVGARGPEDLLFRDDLERWHERAQVEVTVDHAESGWKGHVGAVTRLLPLVDLPPEGLVLTCGPEIMMRFVAQAVVARGVPPSRVFVSTERHMRCGAGLCGRCQHGPLIVCRDGPVFAYDRVEDLMRRDGF